MPLVAAEQELHDRFVRQMVEATLPLQVGPDREVTLHALIAATQTLKERFEQELAELRQESD